MASPIPISPLSAAHILVSWITLHGREPRVRECVPANGLLFWKTLMKKLPGDTLSACISAARTLVSQAAQPRMQACLGSDCPAVFVYTGMHFCPTCRHELGYDAEDTPRNGKYLEAHDRETAGSESLAVVTATMLRQYGLSEEISTEETLVSGDAVHSFDDWIAGQMNAWQRVSRKRRFFEGA